MPELTKYAELDYEQFCNIGSQDMSESIWLSLAKRVNQVLERELGLTADEKSILRDKFLENR